MKNVKSMNKTHQFVRSFCTFLMLKVSGEADLLQLGISGMSWFFDRFCSTRNSKFDHFESHVWSWKFKSPWNSFNRQWKMQTWLTKVEMNPLPLKCIVQIYFYILFYNNKVDRIKFRKYQSMIKSRFWHHHLRSHKCCILLKKVLLL